MPVELQVRQNGLRHVPLRGHALVLGDRLNNRWGDAVHVVIGGQSQSGFSNESEPTEYTASDLVQADCRIIRNDLRVASGAGQTELYVFNHIIHRQRCQVDLDWSGRKQGGSAAGDRSFAPQHDGKISVPHHQVTRSCHRLGMTTIQHPDKSHVASAQSIDGFIDLQSQIVRVRCKAKCLKQFSKNPLRLWATATGDDEFESAITKPTHLLDV
jgi:hypothetical protein